MVHLLGITASKIKLESIFDVHLDQKGYRQTVRASFKKNSRRYKQLCVSIATLRCARLEHHIGMDMWD